MSVQSENHQFVSYIRKLYARDIFIFVGNFYLTHHPTFYIKCMYSNLWILLSSQRISVAIYCSVELSDIVHWHIRLIKTHPCNHFAVCREIECAIHCKLLFVHPVSLSVQYFFRLAIFCNLTFSIIIKQLHEEKISFTYESYKISVWRELRTLLWSSFR